MNVGALLSQNYGIANQMNHIRKELEKSNERLSSGKHFNNPVDIIKASRIEMEMRQNRVMNENLQNEIAKGQVKESVLESVADQTQELAELSERYDKSGLNVFEKNALKKQMESTMNGIKEVLSVAEFAGELLFNKDSGLLGFLGNLPILNLIGGNNKAKELVEAVTEERASNAFDLEKHARNLEKGIKDDNRYEIRLAEIQDVDVAKELLKKTKLELLLDTNVSLFTHNLEHSRGIVYQLLR